MTSSEPETNSLPPRREWPVQGFRLPKDYAKRVKVQLLADDESLQGLCELAVQLYMAGEFSFAESRTRLAEARELGKPGLLPLPD